MNLQTFFGHAQTWLATVGGAFLMCCGVVLLIVAGFFIVKGLIQHGKGQPMNWILIGVMILIGGALAVGGLSLIQQIGSVGESTLKELMGSG